MACVECGQNKGRHLSSCSQSSTSFNSPSSSSIYKKSNPSTFTVSHYSMDSENGSPLRRTKRTRLSSHSSSEREKSYNSPYPPLPDSSPSDSSSSFTDDGLFSNEQNFTLKRGSQKSSAMNFSRLNHSALIRYVSYFRLKKFMNASHEEISDAVYRHFIKQPVSERETIAYFLYAAKNQGKYPVPLGFSSKSRKRSIRSDKSNSNPS